jgi:hypothetical protein
MTRSETPLSPKKIPAFAYVVGGLSFIPLFGIVFGVIAIIWGIIALTRGGRNLAIVGAIGIGVGSLPFGYLFYLSSQKGGVVDDLNAQMAQGMLNQAVLAVEFYKVQHGEYPESLEVLRKSLPKGSFIFLQDTRVRVPENPPRDFYYKRIGTNHYYLRGVAPDGRPFSRGALVPQVETSGTDLGLLTDIPDPLPDDSQ